MLIKSRYSIDGLRIENNKNIQIHSVLFCDCKNFDGDGGAISLKGTNYNVLLSLCSFLKCYTPNNGGCIFSQSYLLLKCISISNSIAEKKGGSIHAAVSKANLISIDCTESEVDSISISGYCTNISNLNESRCVANYQATCLCINTEYLNIKYSTFVDCRDEDGGSFNIYRANSDISYINLINISSGTNANHGLLLFGYGCNANFRYCAFDHNNHPKIITFSHKNDDKIVLNDCWLRSESNTFNDCTTNNVKYISSKTYVIYNNYGMCIQQPISACHTTKKSTLLPLVFCLIVSS